MKMVSVCKVEPYDEKYNIIGLLDTIKVDIDKMIPGTEKQCTKNGVSYGIIFSMYKKDVYERTIDKIDTTYLIEQDNFYKIGFTRNLKSRIDGYETHNINFKVIGYILRNEEKELQEKFRDFHYKKEWFYKNPIIVEEFKNRGMIEYNQKTLKEDILNYMDSSSEWGNEIVSFFLKND